MSNKKYFSKPKELTKEQLDLAIEMAIEGHSITKIAEEMLISTSLLYAYRQHYPMFATSFEQARQEGLEKLADDLITMADEVEDVQRARLKSDNYKWLLSKRKPAVYGDKVDIHVSQTLDISGALSEAKMRVVGEAALPVINGNTDEPNDNE